MAKTVRDRIREVHIVQNDDTLTWAASQLPITEIMEGGVVINAVYGVAQPLAIADVGTVLAPAFIDLTNERDAALAAQAQAEAARDEALAAQAQAEAARDAVLAERDASTEETADA